MPGPAYPDPWVGRWQRDVAAAIGSAHDQPVTTGGHDQPVTTGHDHLVVEAGHELVARWREPHRRYHDLRHLGAVLDAIDLLIATSLTRTDTAPTDTAPTGTAPTDTTPTDGERAGSAAAAARLAAWFHDAVYAGRPGHDEADSADLAVAVLTRLGVPRAMVAEVGRLVRLTADHAGHRADPDDDLGAALLSDADLAVLAAPDADYRRYTEDVRAEYPHVGDADFSAGRASVLQGLLAAEPLFRTEAGRRLWQDDARANLLAELARLTS